MKKLKDNISNNELPREKKCENCVITDENAKNLI